MATEKLISASAARKAILKADPKLAYVIDNVPGVDAVEVVRCKKCKWSRTDANDDADVYYCELRTGRAYHSGDFCSYGERRQDRA